MNDNPLHRYCNPNMLIIWRDLTKRQLQRVAWVELLILQTEQGLIHFDDFHKLDRDSFLEYDQDKLDQALMLEKTTKHDLAADLLLAEQELPVELKGKLHWGATSSDIEDFAINLQITRSTYLLLSQANALIKRLMDLCVIHCRTVVLGRTHLQPAEPTTLGYRFSVYLNELWEAYSNLEDLHRKNQTHKGFKGAVGTQGDIAMVLPPSWGSTQGFPCGQTYPRQRDYRILAILCDFAATLHKMASDIRIMQAFKLVWEGKAKGQIGSSAMPAKSNPVLSERVCAICRHIEALSGECWNTAANSFLERTLDDKISQRWYLSESFIALSGALKTATEIIDGLQVDSMRCMAEVWQEWRAWVPARKLAILQQISTSPRSTLYIETEGKLSSSLSIQEFLAPELTFPQGINSTTQDRILSIEIAAEITLATCTYIQGKLE